MNLISLIRFNIVVLALFFWVLIFVVLWYIPKKSDFYPCISAQMHKIQVCRSDKNFTPISEIPKHVIGSLIVAEDQKFFNHSGFDLEEIKVVIDRFKKKGTFTRGASTITQQLAKNLYLSKERSLKRKAWEAFYTFFLEQKLTKNEILEIYLNIIEFLPNIFGIGAASQRLFRKKPHQLSIAEGILLMISLPNPEKIGRFLFQKKWTKFTFSRAKYILQHLLKLNFIDKIQFGLAYEDLLFLITLPDDLKFLDDRSDTIQEEYEMDLWLEKYFENEVPEGEATR